MQRPGLIEALADVRELRKRVIDRQLFQGYSGWARISGGIAAFFGALLFSREFFPKTHLAYLAGWGGICAFSGILNAFAVGRWQREESVAVAELRPILDLVAPFLVGGFLTLTLIRQKEFEVLIPMWMWIFGLMNISSRHCLPRAMAYIGGYYIICGTIMSIELAPSSFFNPWPMGLVFCLGEIAGGITFLKLRSAEFGGCRHD